MKNNLNQRLQIQQQKQSANIQISNEGVLYQSCPICYWQLPQKQLYSVDSCRHAFCLNCQTKNIQQNITNMAFPRCPQQSCKAKISQKSELFSLLDVPLKNKITNIKNYRKVIANANLKRCQKANCLGLFDVTKQSICQECGSKHCKTCNKLIHQGQCQLEIAINLQMNNKFRQCNVCRLVIQKTEGCTHMHCTCGNYFCYSCGEALGEQHECKPPSHLNFMQSIRWQLQHLQFWYQINGCSCLRLLLCFSPSKNLSQKQKMVWILIYSVTFYPLLILLTLLAMVLGTAIIILCVLIITLFLPLLGLCATNLELFPTYAVTQKYGYCVGLFLVLLLYPVLLVMNLIQVIYQLLVEEGIKLYQILIPFCQMFQGLRYVILSPCLMMVSNEDFYVKNAQQREPTSRIQFYINRQVQQ